ncbi:S26 family signal peptidase [Plantactinospora sp. GCM10030261]|uniref:S26 family signal peptidase n=1 Tax=Plantactinospora sp. GCM10030261 TaxID=3273420 RepID=UPI00362282C2
MTAAFVMGGLAVVVGAGIGWLRARVVVVTIEGGSMEPTLRGRDRVMVRRLPARRLRVGQIVVLERPYLRGTWMWRASGGAVRSRAWIIKRLAALPGDPMPPGVDREGRFAEVPAGRAVVLGDNRDASTDSRTFGLVPLDRVLGVALRRYAEDGPITAATGDRPADG